MKTFKQRYGHLIGSARRKASLNYREVFMADLAKEMKMTPEECKTWINSVIPDSYTKTSETDITPATVNACSCGGDCPCNQEVDKEKES